MTRLKFIVICALCSWLGLGLGWFSARSLALASLRRASADALDAPARAFDSACAVRAEALGSTLSAAASDPAILQVLASGKPLASALAATLHERIPAPWVDLGDAQGRLILRVVDGRMELTPTAALDTGLAQALKGGGPFVELKDLGGKVYATVASAAGKSGVLRAGFGDPNDPRT